MKKQHLVLALASAATLLAGPAGARPYVELATGASDIRLDCSGTAACDTSAAFGRLTAGYAFTPQWAVELSAGQFGKTTASLDVPGVGRVDASGTVRGIGLGVAGRQALTDSLALTGRLGVASNQTEIRGTAAGGSVSESQRNTAPYAGIGLQYSLSQQLVLGLVLDRTDAEFDGEKAAVTMLGLGLRLQF